ncbi:uncharacterized protein LOC117821886 [Notolabrus celidotus]|uniref:uncharacterized protein LOC117821886 n=1 Tax=Notolabrus celidotus TaxID=1203425 RepID=UPI00149038A4|nr:uncharacterized protein LOC117821886 [Notolabrus celidotus]
MLRNESQTDSGLMVKSSTQRIMAGNFSSNSSSNDSQMCTAVYTALFATFLFFLPVFIFVLYLGYQRWRKQRSVATSEIMSHSDVFTMNMVVIELFGILGSWFYIFGAYTFQERYTAVGMHFLSVTAPGQALLHLITCVERYLAVVHPVTYLGLKQSGGVRIRNITIGFVWLTCIGSLSAVHLLFHWYTFNMIVFIISSILICFCSFCVLYILFRPGPGKEGGNRGRVDQSKKRAYQTIMAIICALLLRIFGNIGHITLVLQSGINSRNSCVAMWSFAWFSLPSSLVLPLLFLHRVGKLPLCKRNTG